VIKQEKRAPISGVPIALIAYKFLLRPLERDCFRHCRLTQLPVKLADQGSRSLVIDIPERGERAPGPRLDRHTSQAKRRAIVPDCSLTGAQGQQLKRVLPEPEQADQAI